jgi:hypothetical protein
MRLFSIEMNVYEELNTAYQTHRNLNDKLIQIQQRMNNKNEEKYDPQKYLNNVSLGFRSKSSDNLKEIFHQKGLSKFHNCNVDKRILPYHSKALDESKFEKIKNVYSN